MDRFIGIDYGRKRTGVATSDPLGIFASALDTIDSTKLIDYLKKYATAERILAFVVGYPVNMNGEPSEAQADVDVFLGKLKTAFPEVPVHLEDERFTSVLAQRVMIEKKKKKSERREKGSVDRISAALILQGFLDRRNGSVGLGSIDPLSVPDSLSKNKTRRRK